MSHTHTHTHVTALPPRTSYLHDLPRARGGPRAGQPEGSRARHRKTTPEKIWPKSGNTKNHDHGWLQFQPPKIIQTTTFDTNLSKHMDMHQAKTISDTSVLALGCWHGGAVSLPHRSVRKKEGLLPQLLGSAGVDARARVHDTSLAYPGAHTNGRLNCHLHPSVKSKPQQEFKKQQIKQNNSKAIIYCCFRPFLF